MLKINEIISKTETSKRGFFISQFNELKNKPDNAEDIQKFISEKYNESMQNVISRKNNIPKITYPDLPVSSKVDEIKKLISENQVIILAGETGSGKSTQLPKICLDMNLGSRGLIGHTQPRRLAASSVANRIAEEMNVQLGDEVGCKIRFQDKTNDKTYIKVMTDGILLAEIQKDKFLSKYEVLIIDEAHERSLNIDFILGYLKTLLKKRDDLKIIITSATIDIEKFSRHFENSATLSISGRTYKVDILYRDYNCQNTLENEEIFTQNELVKKAILELYDIARGDCLVFFATQREIIDCAEYLKKSKLKHIEVLQLYGRLSNSEQSRIFTNVNTGNRIILATNVAETSVTVPNIKYVIDTGKVRISRYSYRTKIQRLPIESISQASANQRSGRCGRISAGICIRLYDLEDFESRVEFTDPEILRTNLASVILQMKSLLLGDIKKFPFLERPDNRFINDGYKLLFELKALDSKLQITANGRKIVKLPIDPKLSTMLLYTSNNLCLETLLIIVSFLSIQDPRERPQAYLEKSSQCHSQDINEKSDFFTIVNLWNRYHNKKNELSNSNFNKYVKLNFLSYLRMREWVDIFYQLQSNFNIPKNNKLTLDLEKVNENYDVIHKAIITGLLGQIGTLDIKKEYIGSRGLKFFIFPASALFKKSPKWIVANELVETTKLYARVIGTIDVSWLENLAYHLTKSSYNEPYFSVKKQSVLVKQNISLYGLPIVINRIIQFSKVNEKESREIFIKQGLVEGLLKANISFYQKNLNLLDNVDILESKERRRDLVVDDYKLFEYYDKLIPHNITSLVTLESWYKNLSKNQQQDLLFKEDDLLNNDISENHKLMYPDFFHTCGYDLSLNYNFDPTADDDGITITIPDMILPQLNHEAFDWLVLGMLKDKIIAYMRALPKNIRKSCVPVPYYADAVLSAIQFDNTANLKKNIANELVRITGILFDDNIWNDIKLEKHLYMRYKIVNDKNKVIKISRDFLSLQNSIKSNIKPINMHLETTNTINPTNNWIFGNINKSIKITKSNVKITVFLGLKYITNKGAILEQFTSENQANDSHKKTICQMLIAQESNVIKNIKKNLPKFNEISLLASNLYNKQDLLNSIIINIFNSTFDIENAHTIRNEQHFNDLHIHKRDDILKKSNELSKMLFALFTSYYSLYKSLSRKNIPFDLINLYTSIKEEMQWLVENDFIVRVAGKWQNRYQYYFTALENRLEKAPRNYILDRKYQIEIEDVQNKYDNKIQNLQIITEEIKDIGYLIYELWISWYLPNIKTIEKVSTKRLMSLL